MKTKKSKLELHEKDGTQVPSFPEVGTFEVGTRIREIQRQLGTVENAAKIAGVDSETLNRWMKGATKASFLSVARLALAANRSLDWLATGEGPKYLEHRGVVEPEPKYQDPSMPLSFNRYLEYIRTAVLAVEMMGKEADADRKVAAVEKVVERLAQTEGQADMIEVMRIIRGVLGDPAA